MNKGKTVYQASKGPSKNKDGSIRVRSMIGDEKVW